MESLVCPIYSIAKWTINWIWYLGIVGGVESQRLIQISLVISNRTNSGLLFWSLCKGKIIMLNHRCFGHFLKKTGDSQSIIQCHLISFIKSFFILKRSVSREAFRWKFISICVVSCIWPFGNLRIEEVWIFATVRLFPVVTFFQFVDLIDAEHFNLIRNY